MFYIDKQNEIEYQDVGQRYYKPKVCLKSFCRYNFLLFFCVELVFWHERLFKLLFYLRIFQKRYLVFKQNIH